MESQLSVNSSTSGYTMRYCSSATLANDVFALASLSSPGTKPHITLFWASHIACPHWVCGRYLDSSNGDELLNHIVEQLNANYHKFCEVGKRCFLVALVVSEYRAFDCRVFIIADINC